MDAAARRLRLALDTYEVAEQMVRQRLKRGRPAADDAEVEVEVRAWRRRRPGAQHGDSPGRPSRRFE